MTADAQVVVIGGGIVGCSAAYHLAKRGLTDVILCEADELTSGSTWHAAGNVPNYSGNINIIKCQHYSSRLYSTLAEETDYAINYHKTGSIRLAHSWDRMDEFAHITAMANAAGIEFNLLTPAALKEIYPFLEVDGILGGLWDPDDGDIDPAQVTQAFAKGARNYGAEIKRFNPVYRIERDKGGDWILETKAGNISAEIVVNAAGYRGAEVAGMIGETLPIVVMQHQYFITDELPDLVERGADKLPLLRDPDDSYYLRQEKHALLLGPYESKPKTMWLDGIPKKFAYELFDDDLERLEEHILLAMQRVPILEDAGVKTVVNGPIPYTPNGNPIIGPSSIVTNFFHCCSFSFGICQGGGAGKILADWVIDGQPEWDIWDFESRRYDDYANTVYTAEKAIELYAHEYAIGYPDNEWPAGRPAKTSPVYPRLQEKNAFFGARAGWERALWFMTRESSPHKPSLRRSTWHKQVARECEAVEKRVAILDLPGLSRYEVKGSGAGVWLDSMVTGKLPGPGRVGPNYFCSEAGRVISEMVISSATEDHFSLISSAMAERHDLNWLQRHLPAGSEICIENVTPSRGCLVLVGPHSRDVLSKITDESLSNEDFPWLSAKEIQICYTRVLAMRINYVGELGWEIHVPVENMLPVYDAVWAAGEEYGISDFGIYALDSLRLEKAYTAWKSDLSNECTLLECSLDRFLDLNKGDFLGRTALQSEQESGPRKQLVSLLVDADDADALPGSPVFCNSKCVGGVSSGNYGHRINKSIALAFIDTDYHLPDTMLEVEILGNRRSALVTGKAVYDPGNARLKA